MKKAEKILLTVKPQCKTILLRLCFFSDCVDGVQIISYSNLLLILTDGFGEKGNPASGGEAAVPPNATLEIELELLSWKTVPEVNDDNKVIKDLDEVLGVCPFPYEYALRRFSCKF